MREHFIANYTDHSHLVHFVRPVCCPTRYLFIFYVFAGTISPHGMVFAEVVGNDDKVSVPDHS